MLIRMSPCRLETHQRLTIHFVLPCERDIVLEEVVFILVIKSSRVSFLLVPLNYRIHSVCVMKLTDHIHLIYVAVATRLIYISITTWERGYICLVISVAKDI